MYGAKVSRQGFDVKTASDKQLAFSSEWPLLPIEAEGSFLLTNPSGSYDIYTHNLGYNPVFMVWTELSGKLYSDSVYSGCYVNTSKLIYEGWVSGSLTIHYKIFRRNLLTNYTAPNLSTTDATVQDSVDYGVSVSLPTKSVSSANKRDFGVRSDVRQLMIHQSGYSSASSGTITHNLGYKPAYWFYMETEFSPGQYYPITSTDDFYLSASTTKLTWHATLPYNYNWAYLIFKDPINQIG